MDLTATRHLMPRQLISVIVAVTASSPRSTIEFGNDAFLKADATMRVFGVRHERADARWRGDAQHVGSNTKGRSECSGSEPPLTAAHRDHFVATKCGESSTFGSPPGRRSHPWSVTTRTLLHPAFSKAADAVQKGIDFGIYLTNQQSIERMPQRVELTALGPTAAVAANGHLRLILVENFDPGTRHRIA